MSWKSKYYNFAGNVNLTRAIEGIVADGGGVTEEPKSGYVHVVAYSRKENRHLSFDLYPDGHVENVHTDRNNKAYVNYGGGFF